MAWAKLHTDILGDPKLLRAARKGLRGVEFLPWVIAFAKGADDHGRLSVAGEPAEPTDIAELVPGATRKSIAECLKSLEKIGVLSRDSDGFLVFPNWEKRSGAKASDAKSAIAERVARHRAKRKHGEVTEPPADSDSPPPPVTPSGNALQGVTCNATEEKRREEKREQTQHAQSAIGVMAWSMYPKRAGSNPRTTAARAWSARVKEGVPEADMLAGTERYLAYCEARGIVGTEYVMQAARFYGPNREFEQDWAIPRPSVPALDSRPRQLSATEMLIGGGQ